MIEWNLTSCWALPTLEVRDMAVLLAERPDTTTPYLRACPFCGGKASLLAGNDTTTVQCSECHAGVEEDSSQDAVAKWNHRE